MLQTDIQSDRRIQKPKRIPYVQNQWKDVKKILERQGKSYKIEMKDGSERLVKTEFVSPALKS